MTNRLIAEEYISSSGIMFKRYQRNGKERLKIWVPKTEYVGGFGILGRKLDSLENVLPGVTDKLLDEEGKITFLGNGLSEVALIPAHRYRRGEIRYKPTIVDIFSYESLYKDMITLKQECKERGKPFSFYNQLYKIINLIIQVRDGNLDSVSYCFGNGDVPRSLKGTDLAINSHGPPVSTLDEQLSILKPGGELYISEIRLPEKQGFHIREIKDEKGDVVASIIKKNHT